MQCELNDMRHFHPEVSPSCMDENLEQVKMDAMQERNFSMEKWAKCGSWENVKGVGSKPVSP